MEFLLATLPYLNIGFWGAILARLTGANLSIIAICCLLYLGATPVQAVGMLLTYLVFMQLTYHTQMHRLKFENLRIFHGWRIFIPILFIAVVIVSNPFYGIAAFAGFFLMEVLALLYHLQPENDRLPIRKWVTGVLSGTVCATIGLLCIRWIPMTYYYLITGFVILMICAASYWLGKHRQAFASVWDAILYANCFFLGLFGIELGDWLEDLQRTPSTIVARRFKLILVPVIFCTFVVSIILYSTFSLSGLVIALAATFATRLFGYYQVSGKGQFNILAIGIITFVVFCLFLVQPQPAGVTDLLFANMPDIRFPWAN